MARWLAASGRGRAVIVAHGTRFLGERMAELPARILREHGMHAVLARGPEPTPVLTRAILRRRAAGAVVLNASHNPSEYQGLEVFDPRAAQRLRRRLAAGAARLGASGVSPGSG